MALVDLLVLCWGSLVFLGRFAHVHLFFCVCDMAEGILLGTTQDNNGREAISHCVAIVSRLCRDQLFHKDHQRCVPTLVMSA